MPTALPDIPALTARQIQVAELLVAGATNDQISQQLHLSFAGAQSAVRRLLAATGTTSRTQAAIWALEHGLVPTPAGRILVDAGQLTVLLASLRPAPPGRDRHHTALVHLLAADFVHCHPILAATAARRGATLHQAAPIPSPAKVAQ